MTDLRTQRNLALAGAAVAVAVLLGFVLGRGSQSSAPRLEASRAVAAESAAAAGESATPAPAEQSAPPAASASEPAASTPPAAPPSARRAEAPSRPASTGAANAPASADQPAGERWTQEPGAAPEAAEQSPAPAEPEPAAARPEPVPLTVAEGTQITLELLDPVSSQSAQVGDRIEAELLLPVEIDGRVALPAGSRVIGRVTEAVALGRIGGRARLAFSFESVRVDGRDVPIAAHFAREGKSETGKDAATIAAGAAIGTILGNQAKKNDRGKVIGGVVGAAAGTAAAAATKGETIDLVAGAELRLTLRQAVTVTRAAH